jgi:hypothetical protein
MRLKRKGEIWEVTQSVEEHTHRLIKKFTLKKYLRSHKKIPKEEREFIELLDSVDLSAGRIMDIMGKLYGSAKAVPYDTKAISNCKAYIGEQERFKDIPEQIGKMMGIFVLFSHPLSTATPPQIWNGGVQNVQRRTGGMTTIVADR